MNLFPANPPSSMSYDQALQLQSLQKGINTNFNQLVSQFNNLFNQVWNNHTLTPQQVFDAFGTNAAVLVSVSYNTGILLNALSPGVVNSNPPHSLTINSDGTVTVGV